MGSDHQTIINSLLSHSIETETFAQQEAQLARVSHPGDRIDIEINIPNHVDIESIEPRPTLVMGARMKKHRCGAMHINAEPRRAVARRV